jgi:hypothetical protein
MRTGDILLNGSFLKPGSDLRVTKEEPSLPAQGQSPNIQAQDPGEEIS